MTNMGLCLKSMLFLKNSIEILRQKQGVNLNKIVEIIVQKKHLDAKAVKLKVQRTIRVLVTSGVVSVLNNNAIFENTTLKSSSESMLSLNLGNLKVG